MSSWTFQFCSAAQSCPTLCDPINHSTPGLPVHHQLPEFIQTHVHQVGDAIQPSHPLLSPSPPTFNLSQHQGLFKWVSSSHQVAKVLEFQLQHQSFQWIFIETLASQMTSQSPFLPAGPLLLLPQLRQSWVWRCWWKALCFTCLLVLCPIARFRSLGYLCNNWSSLVAQMVKHLHTMRETWVGKIWRRKWQRLGDASDTLRNLRLLSLRWKNPSMQGPLVIWLLSAFPVAFPSSPSMSGIPVTSQNGICCFPPFHLCTWHTFWLSFSFEAFLHPTSSN